MSTQSFLKGLGMALVAVIVTFFTQTPIPWLLMGLTAACAILTYFGKNLIPWLHSDSEPSQFSLINIGSALLVALGTGILDSVALLIVNGTIAWGVLLKLVLSITFTYFGATVFAPPHSTAKVAVFKK
jgi:hypothetical protein